MPALDGVLVADFSRVLAGPLATMTLGDLGADVIKVERPGEGDDTRSWGPPWAAGTSTYYLAVNRNKRSIALDLTDARDRVLACRLAARADVVVENFMPGVMERFGLGYDAVSAANPRVVYCSITGFGREGEAAQLPGYDLLIQAVSGLMSITGASDGEPTKVGVALVDVITGLNAVNGILAALHARGRTGVGQRIDVSLIDCALASLINQGSAYLNGGTVPGRTGNRHPSIVPYQVFATADGSIAVAAGSQGTWRRLCQCVGIDADDSRFATNTDRVAAIDQLNDILETVFRQRTTAEWVSALTAAHVPAGAVNDVARAYAMATDLELQPAVALQAAGGSVRVARSPLQLSATPVEYRSGPPALDESGDEIRHWLESGE